MNSFSRLYTILFIAITLTAFTGCGNDDDNGGPSKEEKQLAVLSKTWTIKSATQDIDRTDDFKNPDFTLTLSGAFNAAKPKGPYTYSVAGKLPVPSPWAKGTGVWSFGDDAATTIVRGDGVNINYTLDGNTLTLSFTCTTCNDTNGRPASAEGDWVFVFTTTN